MNSSQLKAVDEHQKIIKKIISDACNELEHLKIELRSKEIEIARLHSIVEGLNQQKGLPSLYCNKCFQQLEHESEKAGHETRPVLNSKLFKENSFKKYSEEALQEEQELNSVETESQFVPNTNYPPVAGDFSLKGTTWATPPRLFRERKILEAMFGPGTQPSEEKDKVLVEESPARPSKELEDCNSVPETMPQNINETTPQKYEIVKQNGAMISPSQIPCTISRNNFEQSSPPCSQSLSIRTVSSTKMLAVKKPKLDISQLISPSRRVRDFCPTSPTTPKRNLRTPKKRTTKTDGLLKTFHRYETEISTNGTRKLTQTQLNLACFKTLKSQTNFQEARWSQKECPPVPNKEKNDVELPHSPLHSLENCPDLNETYLSASALKKIADDLLNPQVERETAAPQCSYDRIPDWTAKETKREVRKKLPGGACRNCDMWFGQMGDNKQKQLDLYSRHRCAVPEPDTPEGFWKPVVSPSPPRQK